MSQVMSRREKRRTDILTNSRYRRAIGQNPAVLCTPKGLRFFRHINNIFVLISFRLFPRF